MDNSIKAERLNGKGIADKYGKQNEVFHNCISFRKEEAVKLVSPTKRETKTKEENERYHPLKKIKKYNLKKKTTSKMKAEKVLSKLVLKNLIIMRDRTPVTKKLLGKNFILLKLQVPKFTKR